MVYASVTTISTAQSCFDSAASAILQDAQHVKHARSQVIMIYFNYTTECLHYTGPVNFVAVMIISTCRSGVSVYL